MQPYLLDTKTTDELFLEKLNAACASETEKQNKRETAMPHWPGTVQSAQTDEALVEKKCPPQQNTPKLPPELVL
jgi:hypothetical protein